MRYLGGKTRFAHILAEIISSNARRKGLDTYIEPCCGFASVAIEIKDRIPVRKISEYVIALLKSLQKGWYPPQQITESEYIDIRDNMHLYPPELVGYVGFNCSWGGKWFGGYARGEGRNHIGEAFDSLHKWHDGLQGVEISHRHYQNIDIVPAVYYFDPPYSKTTEYKGAESFNHSRFWKFVSDLSLSFPVFVSSYNAPPDWTCIWETETKCMLRGNDSKRVERLFQRI